MHLKHKDRTCITHLSMFIVQCARKTFQTVLVTYAVLKAVVCLCISRVRNYFRASAPEQLVNSVHPAGDDGTADVVKFTCTRGRRWMAFVPPDCMFDIHSAGAGVSKNGPHPILLATLHVAGPCGRGSIDVTRRVVQFYGPLHNFHEFPPPTLSDIAPFLCVGIGCDYNLEIMMLNMDIITVKPEDTLPAIF